MKYSKLIVALIGTVLLTGCVTTPDIEPTTATNPFESFNNMVDEASATVKGEQAIKNLNHQRENVTKPTSITTSSVVKGGVNKKLYEFDSIIFKNDNFLLEFYSHLDFENDVSGIASKHMNITMTDTCTSCAFIEMHNENGESFTIRSGHALLEKGETLSFDITDDKNAIEFYTKSNLIVVTGYSENERALFVDELHLNTDQIGDILYASDELVYGTDEYRQITKTINGFSLEGTIDIEYLTMIDMKKGKLYKITNTQHTYSAIQVMTTGTLFTPSNEFRIALGTSLPPVWIKHNGRLVSVNQYTDVFRYDGVEDYSTKRGPKQRLVLSQYNY